MCQIKKKTFKIRANNEESFQRTSLVDLHKEFSSKINKKKSKSFLHLVMLRHFAW